MHAAIVHFLLLGSAARIRTLYLGGTCVGRCLPSRDQLQISTHRKRWPSEKADGYESPKGPYPARKTSIARLPHMASTGVHVSFRLKVAGGDWEE